MLEAYNSLAHIFKNCSLEVKEKTTFTGFELFLPAAQACDLIFKKTNVISDRKKTITIHPLLIILYYFYI